MRIAWRSDMHARAGLALSHIVLLSCSSATDPEVTRVSPAQGSYGTIITVEGMGLDVSTKRILFENGVSVTFGGDPETFTTWNDTSIVFRMPTPGAGAFRIDSPEFRLELGRFEPTPWRPITLSDDLEDSSRLDWAALDADTVVEAIRFEASLELRFLGTEGVEASQSIDTTTRTAELVAVGTDRVDGYFFDHQNGPIFGSFTATREAVEVVTTSPPSTADLLVATDRDARSSYAWLSDSQTRRLTKWRVEDGTLSQVFAVDDPADPESAASVLTVRDKQTWRIWAVDAWQDSEVHVYAAHLDPDAASFDSPIELGSADDRFERWSLDGVTLEGELAMDFCGREENLFDVDVNCVSVTADPEGVLDRSESEDAEKRRLRYAFPSGLAPLDCDDTVNLLTTAGTTERPEPLFAPCVWSPWAHKLDASGTPSFLVNTVEASYVLTKH